MKAPQTSELHSYRCACGKLLFQGLLIDSTVQIKCKKCGVLTSFQGNNDAMSEDSFSLMFNQEGAVISASSNISQLLGYTLPEILSANYSKLLPPVYDPAMPVNFDRLWSLAQKEQYFFKSKVTHFHKNGQAITGVMQSKFVTTLQQSVLFSVFRIGPSLRGVQAPEFQSLREFPFFLQINLDGVCLDASDMPHNVRDKIIGQSLATYLDEPISTLQAVIRHLRAGKPFELTGINFRDMGAGAFRLDVLFNPNFDAQGNCTDYSAYVFMSVTPLKRSQRFTQAATI